MMNNYYDDAYEYSYVGGGPSPKRVAWYSTDAGGSYTQIFNQAGALTDTNRAHWHLIKNHDTGDYLFIFDQEFWLYTGSWAEQTPTGLNVNQPLWAGYADSRYWIMDKDELQYSTDGIAWSTQETSTGNLAGFDTYSDDIYWGNNSAAVVKRRVAGGTVTSSSSFSGEVIQDVCLIPANASLAHILVAHHTDSTSTLDFSYIRTATFTSFLYAMDSVTTTSTLTKASTVVYLVYDGSGFICTTNSTSDPVWVSPGGKYWTENPFMSPEITRLDVATSVQFVGDEDSNPNGTT